MAAKTNFLMSQNYCERTVGSARSLGQRIELNVGPAGLRRDARDELSGHRGDGADREHDKVGPRDAGRRRDIRAAAIGPEQHAAAAPARRADVKPRQETPPRGTIDS